MRNWYAQHRQDWIEEMLRIYGFINRRHLQAKFGISEPQASLDLAAYRRDNPDATLYDTSKKAYVRR